MKHKIISLIVSLALLITVLPVTANAEEIIWQPTLGEIEENLKCYLLNNRPDIEYGTAAYAEYLTGVLIEGSDKELAKLENYLDILLYASEYLYQLDCAAILANDPTIFTLPASVKNLTPDQVRQRAAQKEQLVNSICITNAAKNASTYSAKGTFSASNAAKHAVQYGGTHNPNYFLYRCDCTNFVSQAWIAGGLSMRKPSSIPNWEYHTTDYWYTVLYYEPGAIAPSAKS